MLEIKNLCAFYGKNKVLSDINLTFEKGKFYAVIGRNGSGKSTLVKSIAALLKHSGQTLLDGKELSEYLPRNRAKKISYLPQSVPSVPFTAHELVSFGRNPYGDLVHGGKDKAYAALKEVGMEHLAHKKVSEISGGERQLCYFAMNLCQDAEYMILDEPANSCDIEHEARLMSLSRQRCAEGKGVICVLHNLSQTVKYADGIIILDKGRCVFSGSCGQCLEKEEIEKNFGVRKYIADGRIFFSEQ